MGHSRLLLLLLSVSTVAQNDDQHSSPCLLTSRLKAYKTYIYQYTTESRNGAGGTTHLSNGPKLSCQVEIEVPQTCRFIMHTRDCVLSEASVMAPEGRLIYTRSPSSEAFQAAMSQNPLKFSGDDVAGVQLFPEADEPVNILNVKRGIVSLLMVPVVEEEENSFVSTVHGQCLTEFSVTARKDASADMTLSRDLSQCDHFYSRDLPNSPLALLQRLHRPMSKLIKSTQLCNYQFDKMGKHTVSALCMERHIYLPFFYQDNRISSSVTQQLVLLSSKRINAGSFDMNHHQRRPLHFEDPDDKAPVQTKDAVLKTLQDLRGLAGTGQAQRRSSLFHRLVTGLRSLRSETLNQVVPEMLGMSKWISWQALFQCGTAECTSAILKASWTAHGTSPEVDPLVYWLSLQANPDAARVQGMLIRAQYRQSRAIMYALANTVKNFHKGEVTSVVSDVARFMETLLNACSRGILDADADTSFLALRVVGVMGEAMQAVSPSLISSVLRCVKNPDIPLPNQKAAIQALRLMNINDEMKHVLMEQYLDNEGPTEKRVASYLVLMKSPDQDLVRDIVNNLETVRDEQLQSFVVSHLNNIYNSNEPQLEKVREDIGLALRDRLSQTNSPSSYDGASRSYKADFPFGSIQSNIIFNESSPMPKEATIKTTIKAFDYNYDLFEFGVEGSGFEPILEALFGMNGFFTEIISRVKYWDILHRPADSNRMKRQVPMDFLKEIQNVVKRLIDDLGSSPSPEATAYLQLLGREIGYLKMSDMRTMAGALSMYCDTLLKVLPMKVLQALTSSTDNDLFAHYIFMENIFSLPTTSGFPLKFSLAGVMALGTTGGLSRSVSSGMTGLSFMPSAGLEFITQMGVHVPDYVEAGLAMHTNIYHESALKAQVTMRSNQMRLSIPVGKANTQLLSISNKILSVSSGETETVPSLVEDGTDSTYCQPLFRGLRICTIVRYSNATSTDYAPRYPLNGDSRFAVEIQPTGAVSEYTATLTDETLREGKRGRHKTESMKLTLKAEGDDPTEATVSLKYNHNKNVFTTEVVVPDLDVEAGIKLSVTDSDAKGKKMHGVTIDITNRNVPQLTLTGRTSELRLEGMKDAMAQVQMSIPALGTSASVVTSLRKNEDVFMELETDVSLHEISYKHKASLRYDNDKFEVEIKSDLNSEIQKLIPHLHDHQRQLQQIIDRSLDQRVAKTDMKLRHIVTKGIEAGNIWLDKLTAHFPYLAKLRSKRSISDLTLPALPENLFLQHDSFFRYQFNKDTVVVSLPLPMGGKTSEDLRFPNTLSVPQMNVPQIGLNVRARNYPLPSFTIPPSLDFTLPLLGLVEASTKFNSNFYSWEGSVSGGNSTVDVPSYTAQFKVVAQSPLSLLSYQLEGTGMMSGRADENLKYLINSSFTHSLIDTSISVLETLRVTNKLNSNANYRIQASSPLGLQASVYYSAQAASTLNSDDVSGDGSIDGLIKIGSFYTNASYTHSYSLRPRAKEGRGESTLQFNCPFIQVHNLIRGVYANSEFSLASKTNAQRNTFKHVAELKYKAAQLTLKSSCVAKAMGRLLNNKVELGVSRDMTILRVESQADDDRNTAFWLITGTLDANGLDVSSEGSLILDTGRGLHKTTVKVGRNGLTMSGTNSIQCSPVVIENVFTGAIDNRGTKLSSRTKAMAEEGRGELDIEATVTSAEASVDAALKGHAYDASTRNTMKVGLDRRALTFTSHSEGTLRQMKTESSHALTLTLWTLALHSKSSSFICDDIYYKHDLKLGMKPFLMSFGLTNDARLYETSFSHEGSLKLQPSRADVRGSIKAAYGQEHSVLHTYELSYGDLAGTVKYNFSGVVMEAQLSHSCQLEFAGFSSKTICEARMTSEPLRFESSIRSMALPFSLSVDASVSSDGEVHLFGKHTAQLYSRTLAKAEPLVFAYSHDSQVSTTHELQHGDTSTSLDNKYDLLLSPSDQSFIWTLKSKLNNHTYDQDIRAHNSPAKVRLEFSGVVFTDTFIQSTRSPPQTEEFRMSGFLMYNKNIHCHVIHIPYVQSFPAGAEQLKTELIEALESLQQFINSLDINQLIADFRAMLDQLPAQVNAFMQEMDLERRVSQVKAKVDYLIKEFSVSLKDLELIMSNLRKNLEKTVIKTATKIRNLMLTVEDYVKEGHLANDITRILEQVGNQLQAFDGRYEIKQSLLRGLYATEDIIRQIDLQKLTEGSAAWLRELDAKYHILETIKDKLSEMRQVVENFHISAFFQELIDDVMSVDLAAYAEQLVYRIPSSDIANVLESMNDVIVNWIDEYEIAHKLNTVYFYFRDLLVKYNIDSALKDLMDQVVILIKEFKVEQSVQTLVKAVNSVSFEFVHDHILQFLHRVTSHLGSIDIKKSIDDFNKQISLMLKLLKEFDYSVFVDETNKKVVEVTNYVNEQIKVYEIVQKIEAVREFVREIQKSVFEYLDELKNTKVADALKKLRKVIDTTFYNDIKLKVQDVLEDMRQRILDMDIRQEIYIHLQRASEFYSNVVTLISAQINYLIDRIITGLKDNGFITQMKQSVDRVLGALTKAEVHVAAFTIPFTDLRIPEFTVNLNKLQDIRLPAQILVPDITILSSYTIPGFTIDFEDLKTQIIAFLDRIKEFQIPRPDPEQIFGDLKLLYLCDLPDFTLPELTLSEIKLFPVHIPKLNLTEFKITMLPVPEIKLSELPSDICLPLFGKLHGELRLVSPQVTVVTTGKVENSTSSSKSPQFTATVASYATSPIESLKYTFEASAQLEAPRMKKLILTEKVKASHVTFSVDHQGSLTLTGSSVEASLMTSSKAKTQMYTADLANRMTATSRSGISAAISTIYSHNVAIPSITISNQVLLKQNIAASVESGRMTLSSGTTGEGQWSIQDYTDEASHRSNVEVNIDLHTANLTFVGDTDSKALKLKQTVTAESVILSHFTVEAKCEAKAPYVKNSVVLLNVEANLEDLKVQLTASHEAGFTGALSGSMSNLLRFMVHPFETVLEATNKVNSKLSLPLKLTGKVDLQHDYGVILNSEKQLSYWFALARFNQYKYKHNFTAENNDVDAFLYTSLNAEANLDFLTVPLSVPKITMPYLQIATPELRDVSLWRDAGLQALLNTPQQSLDLNLKLHYSKNPDKHSFDVYLEPIYSIISDNANIFQAQFEQCRDEVVTFLKASYSQAKSQYMKHRLDPPSVPPRILAVPGYRIPLLNIDVSAFRAEMPAFGYTIPKEFRTPGFKVPALGFSVPSYTLVLPSLEIPVIHVPESLSEVKLPTLTLPSLQNHVAIPAMGNMTWDFSFKSTVMGVSAHASLYNQSDIVAHFDVSSTSVFDILNGKIDGTTSLAHRRGLKVATTVSLDHGNAKANHDSSVSLSEPSIEASVANYVMFKLPFLNLELNQKLTGSTETKPNVASMKKVKYVFNIPLIGSVGEGHFETNWAFEALPSYVSLETLTQGKSDATVMGGCNIAGEVKHGASFYLDANGLRSTVRTALNSDVNKQEKQKRSPDNVIHFDFNKTLSLDASLRRLFAAVDCISRNHVDLAPFTTNGRHEVKGELNFAPLTTFRTTLSIDSSQPSRLGPAAAVHSITATVGSQRQAFTWSARHQLATLTCACDLLMSNEESEIRVDLSSAVDALNMSLNMFYTKAVDGQEYAIPSTFTDNGVTFSLPDISFVMPSWLEKVPKPMSTDKESKRPNRPEHVTLLPVVSVPAFDLPFTNLQVEAFTLDPKSITIPKVITTKAFEVLLPGLPVISVPSYNVNTEYLQGKMFFNMPQYDIRVSSFALPPSFTIADHTLGLNQILGQISSLQLPTIVVPEQKVEIPEVAIHLPLSVFVPAFGKLGATVKLSSPVYNVSTVANVERKESSLVTSLASICSSTMSFLDYNFSGNATVGFDNGAISLNGKSSLIHNDVNVNLQHVLIQTPRLKRQTPATDLTLSRHTLSVDISSRTFADVSFRFASRKDGITASVSSPSSGFLGFQFQRRSPSQLYGKLFSRYQSAPDKDVDVFTAKATLRNSQKLMLQTTWNWDFVQDVFEGTKQRIPAMSRAVLSFVNKYHAAHFGFDLNHGCGKIKHIVSGFIERVYNQVLAYFKTLQDSIQHLGDQVKHMYTRASNTMMSMSVADVRDSLANSTRQVLNLSRDQVYVLLDDVKQFLSDTKFSVPGSEQNISSLEMFQLTLWSVSKATDRAGQRFVSVTENVSDYVRKLNFTVAETRTVINGNEIMDKLTSLYHQLLESLLMKLELLHKAVSNPNPNPQVMYEKAENFLTMLKDGNLQFAAQVDAIYADMLESSKRHTEEAKRNVAQYKLLTKQKIQELCSAFSLERVSNNAKETVSVFQTHLSRGFNETVDVMRKASQGTAPYVRVSSKRMDVEVPLPFNWKSFSEWPTPSKP